MIIIYDELPNGNIEFIRLNFETGEYSIDFRRGGIAMQYIEYWRKLGYTFIHR